MSEQQESEVGGEQARIAIDLTGQVALVTGAGRGIGKAIALALSDAGASVAVCARSEDEISVTAKEIAARQGHPLAIRADVADRRDVERMVARVEREMGPVDLLVNNAAVHGPIGPLVTTDPDEWWRTIEVNLRGPLYCARAVLPKMVQRGRGRVVNVSSGAGFAAFPMLSSYSVSKAGLYRLTENLAAETGGHGVQVFAISPGLVRTAMSEDGPSCGEPSIERLFQGWFDAGADIPPERAAELVVYLASGEADALSGRCLDVDDDVRNMVARATEIQQQDLYVMRLRGATVGGTDPSLADVVDNVLHELDARCRARDLEGVTALFTEDPALFGSAAGEEAYGTSGLRAFLESFFAQSFAVGWTWERPFVRRYGEVVWFVAVATAYLLPGDGAATSLPYRLSGVLREQAGNRWLFELLNGSVPGSPA
ncbi:MAG TPA: SDR family NAD(P)-dependent oxidoreductase [Acidimicrobiales bacterium]|nr:SDR family NAD(P)-dependent oxidoreductase [Acidimicrobiales bacterium]